MSGTDLRPSGEFRPAVTVPRYGSEVLGGAEDLARKLCGELARRGVDVTVLTTCAVDHYTWADHYPAGESEEDGVRVVRFPSQTRLHHRDMSRLSRRLSGTGEGSAPDLSRREQLEWLRGIIYSEGLIQYLRERSRDFSHLIFLPYLFGTTYFGSRISPEKSYIIPCLHDEAYARLSLIREMLVGVKGLIFNSAPERDLARDLLGISDPGRVVGIGLQARRSDGDNFFSRFPVREPFVLYAGRREEGKNTPLLVAYFQRFLEEFGGRVSLALAGVGDVIIPPAYRDRMFDLGRLSEREKWDAYAAASLFCQPSVNESLSIVLLEAWLAGAPALVNTGCPVTSYHVRRSGGGLAFGDYYEFSEALRWLLSHRAESAHMGERGRQYVESEYDWDSVIDRLYNALGESGPEVVNS